MCSDVLCCVVFCLRVRARVRLERCRALRANRSERKAKQSLPSSAEASMSGAIWLTSHVTSWCAQREVRLKLSATKYL